jgi:hypothetical protein
VDRSEGAVEERLGLPAVAEEIARRSGEGDHLPPPAQAYLTPIGLLRRCHRLVEQQGGSAEKIATSEEGRSIWAFHLGPPGSGGVFLVSLLHACEWIGALALLELVERTARESPEMRVTFVPVANPDGAERARVAASSGSWAFPRGNARGVDLNRNFPPFHRRSGFWSSLPWYRPGVFPASEAETAGIVAIARRERPAVSLSFHSFGRWFFFPPAHRRKIWDATGRHRAFLERIGGAERIGYRSGQLGRWRFWFRAYGTELDFLCHDVGSLAFLIEVSRGGIGSWGARRLLSPFYWFNPRTPEPWIADLVPFCGALIRVARA